MTHENQRAKAHNYFWLNWHWWRTKGCYHFRTCVRCLRPFTKQPLCQACEEDIRKEQKEKRRAQQRAYWQGRAYLIASTPWL